MPRMTTVIRPGVYPPGYQFSREDYVSVPAIDVAGTFPFWQIARFTADTRIQSEKNAQRTVKMFIDAVDRKDARNDQSPRRTVRR